LSLIDVNRIDISILKMHPKTEKKFESLHPLHQRDFEL